MPNSDSVLNAATIYLKMVKVVKFMSCILYHSFLKKCSSQYDIQKNGASLTFLKRAQLTLHPGWALLKSQGTGCHQEGRIHASFPSLDLRAGYIGGSTSLKFPLFLDSLLLLFPWLTPSLWSGGCSTEKSSLIPPSEGASPIVHTPLA